MSVRNIVCLCAVLVCGFLSEVVCLGSEFYVDATAGNDGNSGLSPTTAWRTLARVNSSSFAAGDRVLLKRGQTWREQLIVPSSGAAGQPIVFGAYGEGERPRLKGSALVSNWTSAGGGGIWQAPLSSAPNQVFFNGVRGTRQSSSSYLDRSLEWSWASGVLYVYATSDPDSAYGSPGIEASIRPATRTYGLVHVQGRSYVTLEGLDVSQSASYGIYLRPPGQYLTVRDCEVSHSLDGGLVAPNAGGAAVSQVTVENCRVHHNNGGFKEGAPGVATYHEGLTMELVDGFTIRGCQVYANYMEGVNFKRGARNGVIENCRLYANDLINQYMEGATNVEFRYNRVYDCSYNAGLEFGLETNTWHNDNIRIHHNLFYNNSGGISFWALGGATAQTRNIQIHNNTFYNNWEAVRWKSGATDNYSGTNSIKNNLFWQKSTSNWAIRDYTSGRQALGRTAVAYNSFQQGAASDMTGSNALLLTDPYFANAGALDFHLRWGSACIDAGTDLAMLQDFDGTSIPQGSAPDIGCYEYAIAATYVLTTSATNGTVTRMPDKAGYTSGEVVTLQAVPNTGYSFTAWSGDLTGTANPATLAMHSNKSVTAGFVANTYTLTISAVNGSVTKNPDKTSYTYGEVVTLQVVPVAGYSFSGWSGDASGTGSSTMVTINANKSVVANFTINAYMLSISAVNGSVTSNPDKASYAYGEAVTLQAVPAAGYSFSEWSGDASGTASVATVTMNADKFITASFTSNGNPDRLPPVLSNCSPAADSIQVPPNSLLILHLRDEGQGVDPASVSIRVDGDLIYTDDVDSHRTAYGVCRRSGTGADFTYVYQSDQPFHYSRIVTITVNAGDRAGNVMSEQTYSFATEMYSFGAHQSIAAGQAGLNQGGPATATDRQRNLWAVWHGGNIGQRQVYAARRAPDADAFSGPVQLSQSEGDHSNPVLAVDTVGTLFVVWQENPRGVWDVCLSMSTDGEVWSQPRRLVDSNDNQVNPAIVAGSQSGALVAIAWQDDRAGNQDIYVARSTNAFASSIISRVTSDAADQTHPVVAVDSEDTVFVFWTDARNGSTDIYGAASNTGFWTNTPIVSSQGNQSQPAVTVGLTGPVLHLSWVDDAGGDRDVFYAAMQGLPGNPIMGRSIVDDTSESAQQAPAISVAAQADGTDKIFVCWEDARNVAYSGDTDLYLAEVGPAALATNVLVGDGRINSNQREPALGIDRNGYPHVLWTDGAQDSTLVCCAGATYAGPVPLVEKEIAAPLGGIVGVPPENIRTLDDVSVVIPARACPLNATITIARVSNPQGYATESLRVYDFGPSGLNFAEPVTVTVPYPVRGTGKVRAYWFDSATATFSNRGITDVEDIAVGSGLHALRFNTTHFTPYYLVVEETSGTSGSGGGGGCSLAAQGNNSVVAYFVPYLFVGAVMLAWRRRGAGRRSNGARSVHRPN